MIEIISGPLVTSPQIWNLVFERSTGWWRLLGRYKHVRAYGYAPFLHVWLFVDVGLCGFKVFAAADGEPFADVLRAWIRDADVIAMVPRRASWRMPVLGFCVPSMKRLLGINSGALRPSALHAWCLRNGGVPFEAPNVPAQPTSVSRVSAQQI